MPETGASLAATFRLLRILYFAFLASVPVYFVIGQVLGDRMQPAGDLSLLRNVFWLAGAFLALMALAFRYRLIPALPPAPIESGPAGEVPAPTLGRLRSAYIASFALAESVAVLGLVLRLLGGAVNEILPFFAVAVVLFVLLFPRLPDTYVG